MGWERVPATLADKKSFLANSLKEYAAPSLFSTVGIDRGYYNALDEETLGSYASMLPSGFRAIIKMPQTITTYAFPNHPSFGNLADERNPQFLDADYFNDALLPPFENAFADHVGVLLLQLPPAHRRLRFEDFLSQMRTFLSRARRTFSLAFELRDPHLLQPKYADLLREFEGIHGYNYWSNMPSLVAQRRLIGDERVPLRLIRLMLPPAAHYSKLKEKFEPFDRIVAPQPKMRDETITLIHEALEKQYETYVIVNNKAEGCSPETIAELARRLANGR
ncbi:MAG: DUF72 domain-containing protein [Polyangiales bacterium]